MRFYSALVLRDDLDTFRGVHVGCDVVTVQRALGHAKATTTLSTYSHLWPSAEDRTRTAAGNLMGAVLHPTERKSDMTLRSYEPEGEWEITDEPCQNCGEPVWKAEVVGIHPEGVAHFGTAYKCPACNYGSPSKKPLEDLHRLIADSRRTGDDEAG